MTCTRWPVAGIVAALVIPCAVADEPGVFFPFKEYPHPIFPIPRTRYSASYAFSTDGKQLAVAGEDRIVVLNSGTGKQTAALRLHRKQNAFHLAFSADGKSLLSDAVEDTGTRFWDLKTGEQLREQMHPKAKWSPGSLSPVLELDPRGERMVTRGTTDSPELRIYDVATGKAGASLEGTSEKFWRVVFSPDGKRLAYLSATGGFRLLDTTTGKTIRELIPDKKQSRLGVCPPVFSPDGKYVASGEPDGTGNPTLKYLTVWSVADGERCARVFTGGGFTSVAFAGDGRTLAATGNPHGLYLYDLATDTLHLWSDQPRNYELSVIASPDGSTLALIAPATRGGSRSLYIMPFAKYDDDSFGPTGPSDKELADSWDGAVGENAFRRAHEIKRLRPVADRVIALARKKVEPVPDLYRRRAEDLIENLASPDIREKVAENLQLVAHDFEPLLESAQKKTPAGEVRNRLSAILQKMRDTPPPEKLMSAVRAVKVLDGLGTPEAKKILEELAAGASGARVTEEAAAALKKSPEKPR